MSFTFRAHQHGNANDPGDDTHGYATFSAARYEVLRNETAGGLGGGQRKLVALFMDDDPEAEAKRVLTVGRPPGGVYDVIYVMNAAGKTVDTIR